MISTAHRYIYLQTEHFISHTGTINRVAQVLADRLIKAHRPRTSSSAFYWSTVVLIPFTVHSRINSFRKKSTLHCSFCSTNSIEWVSNHHDSATEYLLVYCGIIIHTVSEDAKKNEDNVDAKPMFITEKTTKTEEGQPEFKYIRGMLCIQDGHNCLISGSSVCDRSLSRTKFRTWTVDRGRKTNCRFATTFMASAFSFFQLSNIEF